MSSLARTRAGLLVRMLVFVLVTGALTVVIGAQIARISVRDGYRVSAIFDDASGLLAGDQVKIAGAPVGRVDAVEVEDGKAVVRLRVQDGPQLPADSEAAIRWRNVLGQRVVYLIPGTSPDKLADGARVTRTRSVVDLGELINQFAPLSRALKPEQLNTLLRNVGAALEGNEQNVDALVTNVDKLSSTIAARRQTLSGMLGDYATLTEVVARRDKQIAKLTDDLVTLSRAFVDSRELVDDAVVQLAAMMRTSEQTLGANADRIGALTDQLAPIIAGTLRNTDTIRRIIELAGPKLPRIFSVTDQGEYAMVAVPCLSLGPAPCPYPMRYPDSSRQGGG